MSADRLNALNDDLPIVDAHHHLWDLAGDLTYPWHTNTEHSYMGDNSALRRTYMPPEFRRDSALHNVIATVHIEAECDRSKQVRETEWLTKVAAEFGMPNAIVAHAWIDEPNSEEILLAHKQFPLVRGIRTKPIISKGPNGSVRGQLMGEIHLCMVDAMCSNRALRLESALAEFTRAAPQVVLHVEIAAPQTALQGLVEEHYHVIVTPMARDASPLKLTRVFAEEQALYCGRGHALLATPDSRLDRALIERQRYAGRTYMSGWKPPYDLRLEPCARASHMESIALLILSGEYIGYLPCHYAAQWVESGEMRALRREDTSYREDFYVGRRRNERNRAAQVLVECLLRQLHDD